MHGRDIVRNDSLDRMWRGRDYSTARWVDLQWTDRGPEQRQPVAELGVLESVPTAIAGAADWADLSGTERRIGAVHALGADTAIFLFTGSLVARLRGRHRTGTKLALAGNLVIAGAGFLGGHLALNRGTARRDPLAESN